MRGEYVVFRIHDPECDQDFCC